MAQEGSPENPRSLSAHFEDAAISEHPSKWNELWEDEFTPWDRGGPSLALMDLLDSEREKEPRDRLVGLPTKGSRKRALVPGCGRGYDVLLLRAFGYDVTGLDVSPLAIAEAVKNAAAQPEDGIFLPRDLECPGTYQFVEGDFWGDVVTGGTPGRKFDLIFDYTFLCALPPSMRPAWARRMIELLAPAGRLICLEFPSSKDPSEAGPAWALSPQTYLAYLGRAGQDVRTDEHGGVHADQDLAPRPGGLKRIVHNRPERTHKAGMKDGKVDDYISVWAHVE